MSKFGVMVMGPAGAGKTTFCSALISHLRLNKRSCYYINLDPAAENLPYEPDLDIKTLISLQDVMEEMSLGPNGGLIFCFEFLLDHLEDFLSAEIETITEDYLIIIDMPGQIELYTHVPIVPALVKHLIREGSLGINLCAAYLIESTFVMDRAKFFAGTLSAMSAMLMLEVPHINILSKIDLVKGNVPRKELKRFIDPDSSLINDDPSISAITIQPPGTSDATASDLTEIDPLAAPSLMHGKSFKRLNTAVAQLVEEYGMVSFLQLDVQSEDSVGAILSYIDDVIQFHEAQEPREPNDEVDFDYGD